MRAWECLHSCNLRGLLQSEQLRVPVQLGLQPDEATYMQIVVQDTADLQTSPKSETL